jgi:hypothetical protein
MSDRRPSSGNRYCQTDFPATPINLPPLPGKFADVGGLIYGTAAFPELVFANEFQGKRQLLPIQTRGQ